MDEQVVDSLEAKRADLGETEKNLTTPVTHQAVSNRSCTQVASDHENCVKASAKEPKAWRGAANVLQPETFGAEGRIHCFGRVHLLVQRHRHIPLTMVRRLAEKEHSAAFGRLTSSISAMMKFSAKTGGNPFVKVKGFGHGLDWPVAGREFVSDQPEGVLR